MKNIITITITVLISMLGYSQGGGIGTINADPSAVLELASTTQGLLPPRLTTLQRGAITSPAVGLLIYNTDTDCLNTYASNGAWLSYCGTPTFMLDCASATVTGTLTAGVSASGVSAAIPYTDGDGTPFAGQAVNSTGVIGLTATILAGNFAVGSGSLTYAITGSALVAGAASFTINIGGASCILIVNVGATVVIPGNATCAAAVISATTCTPAELASGIGLNAHDGQPYTVVNIGNQCWMAENIDVNTNDSGGWIDNNDTGWSGYYNGAFQADKEGTLFQWSAAMNGATTERAQGVCPTGWHVPSDCEFMYLENTLGMSVVQQELTGWRGSNQGTQLKPGGSSGFEGLFAGYRSVNGSFTYRGTVVLYWSSSSPSGGNDAYSRALSPSNGGLSRDPSSAVWSWPVRCLKD